MGVCFCVHMCEVGTCVFRVDSSRGPAGEPMLIHALSKTLKNKDLCWVGLYWTQIIDHLKLSKFLGDLTSLLTAHQSCLKINTSDSSCLCKNKTFIFVIVLQTVIS